MNYSIALVSGDGIGPEVTGQAVGVLKCIGKKFGHGFTFQETLAGGAAIDACGEPLPERTLEICKSSDAVLLGAVGGPKWDTIALEKRPERALLGLRGALGLYANLRPAILYQPLKDACPLKPEISGDGIDIMVVRELIGGIYFGERGRSEDANGPYAWDTEKYAETEIRRIARTAFGIAVKRNKKVTSVDKSNVIESSRLWREIVTEVAKEFPGVVLEHMYVDNAAMQLIKAPRQFDVLLTTNMFGDILSDEASQITGSIGLLPSASLNERGFGMFEPIHGSAPDIAGMDIANPIAAILSAAMMLKYSFGLDEAAACIENAVESILEKGYRTADIMSDGMKKVGTVEMGSLICSAIEGV